MMNCSGGPKSGERAAMQPWKYGEARLDVQMMFLCQNTRLHTLDIAIVFTAINSSFIFVHVFPFTLNKASECSVNLFTAEVLSTLKATKVNAE